jgi:uncharacterized protein (TIGR04168 family)
VRVAVVGDVHTLWDEVDVRILDGLGYDLVLFTGDLGDRLHRRTLDVARRIAPLRTRALMVPGNHDGTTPLGVLAEAVGLLRRRPGSAARHRQRLDALREALGPVELGGFSAHRLGEELTVVVARPHAMDGRRASFPHAGPRTLDESRRRLRDVVDQTDGPLLFLAHNGPLGPAPFARRRGRPLADTDLADAIAHARARGQRVVAVVAGHLHHRGDRPWRAVEGGVLYVNAARVPRVRVTAGRTVRHHVALEITAHGASAREVSVPADPPSLG